MSSERTIGSQQGIALLGTLVIVLILSLLGATLLHLSGQDRLSAGAGKAAALSQNLADAAAELVVGMFHHPEAASSKLASIVIKRSQNAAGVRSFFDQSGRSQFIGTAARPDLLLDARDAADNGILNDPQEGLFHALSSLGTIEELKIYAPSRPGLLCTVDATVATLMNPPFRQSISLQLSALEIPPLRSAVQTGQSLGANQAGQESPVRTHWGSLTVKGDLALHRANDIPKMTIFAPVTGQSYDDMSIPEDRWMEAWIGGQMLLTQPAYDPIQTPTVLNNIHVNLNPIPGLQIDHWGYDQLKTIAKQHGTYYAIDREGLLYAGGHIEPGRGLSPDAVLHSSRAGDQLGLIFIDTLDQTAPRADNLGTVIIHGAYVEGLVVVQGHVVLSPTGSGESLSVLSPPTVDRDGGSSRTSVQLSQINVNGVVYAEGNIAVVAKSRVFGAVTAGGTISSTGGGTLEVWYNHEYTQGLYRGIPVVYPAPGTWMAKY